MFAVTVRSIERQTRSLPVFVCPKHYEVMVKL